MNDDHASVSIVVLHQNFTHNDGLSTAKDIKNFFTNHIL
jgi:hypothetical protein